MRNGGFGFDSSARASSPPLPVAAEATLKQPASGRLPLASGCYLINYTPAGKTPVSYDGTLRLERMNGPLMASGDLYQRAVVVSGCPPSATLAPPPDPAAGIPIFPIKSYRFYLRVMEVRENGNDFDLAFEMHRFDPGAEISPDGKLDHWPLHGAFTAPMSAAPADGLPGDHFVGDLKDDANAAAGRLTMRLVSPYLRKATVEIDRVHDAALPLDNGAGITWRTVFDKVGWDIAVAVSDSNVQEPSGESWNEAEAHQAMQTMRDTSDLDSEWRFHILAVRRIDKPDGERGYMYDVPGFDPNHLPREGLLIASHWTVPLEDKWGLVKGRQAGTVADMYFRTAVHETGHAMGLGHNGRDLFFMQPTDSIAAAATAATPFPKNIVWSFARGDEQKLRHWPDLAVRPGGISLGSGSESPLVRVESERHRLEVSPVSTSVPIGAPVRVDVSLVNATQVEVEAPSSVGLKSGFVRGRVIDPSGFIRTFAPLQGNLDDQVLTPLPPGESISDSLTLWSGGQGELFRAPGVHRISVEVSWPADLPIEIVVTGETRIMVTAAADAAHADAALKVLTTPETLLALAFGGDHLKEGIKAIGAALKNDVLRPHFAYIEAKRVGTRFGKRPPDLKAAAELIDQSTVMSPAEFRKAMRIAEGYSDRAGAAALAAKLKARSELKDERT